MLQKSCLKHYYFYQILGEPESNIVFVHVSVNEKINYFSNIFQSPLIQMTLINCQKKKKKKHQNVAILLRKLSFLYFIPLSGYLQVLYLL